MRNILKQFLRTLLRPFAQRQPLEKWNYWLGRIYEIKLPGRVKSFLEATTGCSANINIVMSLLGETRAVEGDVAECGVFRGATLVPVTYYLHQEGSQKAIYGFDSFEGFDDSVKEERFQGDRQHIDLETDLFRNTSVDLIREKLRLTHTNTEKLQLIPGFFENSLPVYSNHWYSFVHLDCDLASSYLTCLSFFYTRMSRGGIILFDEYNDPVYQQTTETIDTFFSEKPEKPERIERDNYVKYFVRKQ